MTKIVNLFPRFILSLCLFILIVGIYNITASNAQIPSSNISNAQIPSSNISNAQIPSSNISNAQIPSSNISNAQIPSNIISCQPIAQPSIVNKTDVNPIKVSSFTNISQLVHTKLQEYQKTPNSETSQELENVLNVRKRVLVNLIREDPTIAISDILAPDQIEELNKISNNCVEKFVTVSGQLQVQVADLGNNTAFYRYDLVTKGNGTTITLHPALGLRVPLTSGAEVLVSGFLIDNDLIFVGSSSPSRSSFGTSGFEVLRQPSITAQRGVQRVLVLLIDFDDTPTPIITTSTLQNTVINTVNNYYISNSYNDISITGVVFGRYDLAYRLSSNPCPQSDPNQGDLTAAITTADSQVDFRNFDHLVLVGPYTACLRGLGDIGSWRSIQTADSNTTIPMALSRVDADDSSISTVISHELGHNFGLGHAHSIDCGGNTITVNYPNYNDCFFSEYGDPFDVMGPDWDSGHLNAPHMEKLGWIDPYIETVEYGGEPSRRFFIEPIETIPPNDMQSHVKALKIPRANGDFLYVEYRQPIFPDNQSPFFSSSSDVFRGALLHILNGGDPSDTYLIDNSPDGRQDIRDFSTSVMNVGSSFDDPGSNIRVTVVSADSNGLTIDVDFFPVNLPLRSYKFLTGWGVQGSGDGRFFGPGSLVMDRSGNLYIADGSRVQKYTGSGQFLGWLGKCTGGNNCDTANQKSIGFSCSSATCTGLGAGSGDGQFSGATHISIDNAGRFYVLDVLNRRVQVFNNDGTFVMKWGSSGTGDGQFILPTGIAVDPRNNIVFVVDSRGSAGHSVQGFLLTGTCPAGTTRVTSGVCFSPLKSWSSYCDLSAPLSSPPPGCNRDGMNRITGSGQFGNLGPSGIAVDTSGNVYVADVSNNRVQKFSNNGRFITTWGFPGTGNGQFQFTTVPQVIVNSLGSIYVTDDGNNRVQQFSNNGRFITTWGNLCNIINGIGCNLSAPGAIDPGDGQFLTPYGIGFAIFGNNIFVGDISNHRVQVFEPSLVPFFP